MSLASAIKIFTEHMKDRGVPLEENDPRQQKFWYETQTGKFNSLKKILFKLNKDIDILSMSPTKISKITHCGSTNEKVKVAKEIGNMKKSAAAKGRYQLRAVESCAIHLLLTEIKKVDTNAEWSFAPAFDGLKTDFLARHSKFPAGLWVTMQMKSVFVQFVVISHYIAVGQYDGLTYCVLVGMAGYVMQVNPSSVPHIY